jgi:hypothetical protein
MPISSAARSADRGPVPAEQARHDADVLLDRHVREQADLLDRVADPPPQRGRVEAVDVLAVDGDPPAVFGIAG